MHRTIRWNNLLNRRDFDQRTAFRETIAVPITVVLHGTRYNALLCNLSGSGAMIMTAAPLTVGGNIEFQCGSICTGGTVSWQRERDFGIQFSQPISDRQLSDQVSRSNAIASWREGRVPVIVIKNS